MYSRVKTRVSLIHISFPLCAECLTFLLSHAEMQRQVKEQPSLEDQEFLTHFFADESLLFCRTTIEECQRLQEMLMLYNAALGPFFQQQHVTSSTKRQLNFIFLMFQLYSSMTNIWASLCWLKYKKDSFPELKEWVR